jgi:uncharacterized protein YbjT (DUF2867 family)
MPRSVLVTGGTGRLGSHVVPRLADAGLNVRVLSRKPQRDDAHGADWTVGDLRSGDGVDAATSGVDVIVHCATATRGDAEAARNLIGAARHAGSPHLVYVSIVGVDALPMGYYRTKLRVESLVADSGLPFTIVRATQFHDLLVRIFAAQRFLPALLIPARTSFQPIAPSEVAGRLVELSLAEASGRVADLGGPQILDAGELARVYLHAVGRHRRVQSVRIPGSVGRGLRAGANLTPEHAAGRITFEQHLAARRAG